MNNSVPQNLHGEYSGFVSRLMAFLLDGMIIGLTIILTVWLIEGTLLQFAHIDIRACPLPALNFHSLTCNVFQWGLGIFSATFPFLYTTFFWVIAGQTPGKYALGLRVVRMNGKRIHILTAMIRFAGYLLCFLSLGVGFLWILLDNQRQGWHDQLAGTCVVYSWQARQDDNFIGRLNHFLERGKQNQQPALPENITVVKESNDS